ncbi:hypothetical protein [Pseudonocardia abyssalis]|jgi:hypothetical protein|uniref:Uncharacterized protein n=1 Tax=Pseudonocardia abyssalis TaxID=2792008 RepID=A0ABS6UPG6_9PSEU|nr:hypothetical protein [Pseudonocardia abyssalis]MBW0117309.1 hypothetical protein [Pseudonocardia abyssalis]MBW0134148.1 hypothetical protein [Pseudonocardia abyssalis]
MVLALVIAGIGVLLLVGVLVAVLPRLRRLSAAAADLRGGLDRGRAALPAVRRPVG